MWKERQRAVLALGKTGDIRTLEYLLRALDDNEMMVRWAACRALGQLGFKEAVEGLCSAAEDVEPDIRKCAVQALGKIGHADGIPAVHECLLDDEWSVRLVAVNALRGISSPETIPLLVHALEDISSYVRADACRVAEEKPDGRLITPLIQRLADLEPAVQRAAVEGLRGMGEEKLASAYAHAILYHEPTFHRLVSMGEKGDVRLVTVLVEQFTGRLLSQRKLKRLINALEALYSSARKRINELYCLRDYARFEEYKFQPVPFQHVPYVACRKCGSTLYTNVFSRVRAVLDHSMEKPFHHSHGLFRVNWFHFEAMFDFDQVEIGEASDEEVLAFTLKIANDMDPYRTGRPRKPLCFLRNESTITPNTIGVLGKVYENVVSL